LLALESMKPHLISFVLVAVVVTAGCGAGGNAGTGGLSGQWSFHEVLDDQGNGIQCTDEGTWTLIQSGSLLTGQDVQTGTCVHSDGTQADNGDSEQLTGAVGAAAITFTEAGALPCVYTSSSLPENGGLSGTVSCVGTFYGVAYDFSGAWSATKM
jgi:hypothetical protein